MPKHQELPLDIQLLAIEEAYDKLQQNDPNAGEHTNDDEVIGNANQSGDKLDFVDGQVDEEDEERVDGDQGAVQFSAYGILVVDYVQQLVQLAGRLARQTGNRLAGIFLNVLHFIIYTLYFIFVSVFHIYN